MVFGIKLILYDVVLDMGSMEFGSESFGNLEKKKKQVCNTSKNFEIAKTLLEVIQT